MKKFESVTVCQGCNAQKHPLMGIAGCPLDLNVPLTANPAANGTEVSCTIKSKIIPDSIPILLFGLLSIISMAPILTINVLEMTEVTTAGE